MIYLSLRFTCMSVPVQIEGDAAGHEFYYRSRHGRWRFELPPGEFVEGGEETIHDHHDLGVAVNRIWAAVTRLGLDDTEQTYTATRPLPLRKHP